MAATVTNAWAKPGAWALDSEEHEDELNQEKPAIGAGDGQSPAPDTHFPDLMTATKTKKKKKKGQTLSLGQFVTGSTNKPRAQTYQAAKGLTAEDMTMLPTGPRERSAEELDRNTLGGGFRSSGSRWGSNRVTGDGDDGRKSNREKSGPSRADEIDDWGATKKSPLAGGGGFDRKDRGSGFFEGSPSQSQSHSRADESDRWVSNKSHNIPSERRNVGFESSGGADSSENWGKKKDEEFRRFGSGAGGGAFDSLREIRGGNESFDSDNWGKKRDESSGGGGSMSRPKLNLQPRKLPVAGTVAVDSSPVPEKANKGLNPFGDARPREEVLKEKGKDWKEIDKKLESMKMTEDGQRMGFRADRSDNDQTERSWRKNEAMVDVLPQSVEDSENGHAKELEGKYAQA